MEVLGHNNTFKYLRLLNNPSDSGFHNKFTNVELAEEEENITYDTSANHQNFDSSSSSSSDDDDDDDVDVHTTNFHFDTNMNGNMQDFVLNIQSQVGNLLNGINLTHNVNSNIYEEYDSESSEEEEEKYYDDEPEDEESHISAMERANIINSINSFAYEPKKEEEDENCAVCLSKLETGQQVKALPCEHIFHPR